MLYIISGPNKGKSFPLEGDVAYLGRSPENQIHIEDKSVSRKHLKITNRDGKYFFKDLNSRNGTFIDNKPLQPGEEVLVPEKVPVSVGSVVICLGEPAQWDILYVDDSINLFKDTGAVRRPMSSPRNLDLIYKISNVLMQSLNINETMEKILDYIFELLNRIDRGVIILVDSETGETLDVISRSSDRADKNSSLYSRSIVEKVISERNAVTMSDTQTEKECDRSESMEIMRVRSVMCVPLISKSQIRGVLYVDSVNKPYGFRKEDLSLLSALSGPAAVAIENSLLYSKMERLVDERTRSLQQTQEKLKESEARFKEIFDNMSNGVVVYRPVDDGRDFVVLDLNKAFQNLERISVKKEVIGQSIFQIFPEIARTELLDLLVRVLKTGLPERSSVCHMEEQKLLWQREYYVYRLPSNEIVTIFEDVTEKRTAEEEQKALQRQLFVSQKMESIGAFASGTAHNFRNILQAISGNTEYLQMTHGNEPEFDEMARSIYESVERGVDLINNLLHFSRRGGKYEFMDLDLSDVVRSACSIVQKVFDKNIEIISETEEGLMTRGNHSLLSQALLNLFDNAKDAMPNGGKLTVKAGREGDQLVMSVSDTGTGMKQEVLEKIFDPFFTLKEVGKGTGLGLSTSHGIVEDHKGVIQVFSKLGSGTTFKIFLPALQVEKVTKPDPEKRIILGNGQKIMVVDDELPALEALVAMIDHLGYRSFPFSNPLDALEEYKKISPDLVLMDRNMPGVDGITCIREILEMDPNARFLIVSGYEDSGPDGIGEGIRAVIEGYIIKPCRVEELSIGISRALTGARSALGDRHYATNKEACDRR
jgi:signal transduction histidine kinase/ActR/RegA family two-component response regulator